jgi:hypothetical protein
MTYSDDIKRLNIFSFYESLATEILNHILELGVRTSDRPKPKF